MLTKITLETSNLKAGSYGDPVWIAHIERDGATEHQRKHSPSTQMRLLPLALLEALTYVRQKWPEDEILIHCDNEYLVLGMLTWRFDWATQNWHKKNNEPLEHRDLWPEIHSLASGVTLMLADAWRSKSRVLASTRAKHRYDHNDSLLKARNLGPYSPIF